MWTGFLNNLQSHWPSRSGVIPKGSWTAVDAIHPSLSISNFTVCHRAWGVTSQFPTFVSNCSSVFVWVIRLMVLVTQLTAVLHAGFRVTCHSLLNLCLCFSRFFRPGTLLCGSESVILLVDNLYAEAIEAVKLLAALSLLPSELIWTLGDINSEARVWNRSQSVNLSTGFKRFLVLTSS
jgi:hypothetical protein